MTFPTPIESGWVRWGYLLLAALLLAGFVGFTHTYWVPANGGVDQNGYFVGGKEYARHLSPRQTLVNPYTHELDPYLYVGTMWIGADLGTKNERYYPKYPLGLPMLVAAALKIGGAQYGQTLAYMIDPAAMAIAVGATFFLIRMVAGSLAGLLGMLVFATSPVTLGLTNEANSHAGAVCCAAVGMLLLMIWWRKPAGPTPARPLRWWNIRRIASYALPLFAGLFLGYAATLRYTEGTLIGAAGLVILFKLWPAIWAHVGSWPRKALSALGLMRAREMTAHPRFLGRTLYQSITLVAGWLIPVGYLVGFNLVAFGAITGYDPTNESSGFKLAYFEVNWETMLRQMNNLGMYLVFPLALLGLIWMFWWSWRLACILCAWILPCLTIYSFYYWAPDGNSIGYLRFFLTVMPALTLCGYWLLAELPRLGHPQSDAAATSKTAHATTALVMGVLTAIALLLNVQGSVPHIEQQLRGNLMLARAANEAKGFGDVPAAIPDGSVVFGPQRMLNYFQFISDDVFYDENMFNTRIVQRMAKIDPDEPQYLAPQRAKVIYERLKRFNDRQLVAEQQRVVLEALDHGRKVFFIVQHNQLPATRLRFAPTRLKNPDRFEVNTVAAWNDPNIEEKKPRVTAPRRHPPPVPTGNPKQSLWYIVEVKRATTPADTTGSAVLRATDMLRDG